MKNNFSIFLKLINNKNLSTGFTLIELLVAMSLTVIVTTASGFGLVAIMKSNSKADTRIQRRSELNRALDFINDEVRTANIIRDSDPPAEVPTWATDSDTTDGPSSTNDWINKLIGTSPDAKFFIQIPLKVEIMASGSPITITKHGFLDHNAVMFTGPGAVSLPLEKNKVYYVKVVDLNTFNVFALPSLTGTAISLTTNSLGSLTANRLLIYYIRDNTPTWLPPKIITRSVGPCKDAVTKSNCDTLVDSIAANGFTADVTALRQAELNLIGKPFSNSSELYKVNTKVFARSSVTP